MKNAKDAVNVLGLHYKIGFDGAGNRKKLAAI